MGHKCILCGAELPNKRGGRCYCKECAAYMQAERVRKQNEDMRTIKIATAPPPKVKREVTLKRADMDYCRKCIHHGNFDHCVLCEYMFQTGHRRGCKPGVGCEKRETVAKRSGGSEKENANAAASTSTADRNLIFARNAGMRCAEQGLCRWWRRGGNERRTMLWMPGSPCRMPCGVRSVPGMAQGVGREQSRDRPLVKKALDNQKKWRSK